MPCVEVNVGILKHTPKAVVTDQIPKRVGYTRGVPATQRGACSREIVNRQDGSSSSSECRTVVRPQELNGIHIQSVQLGIVGVGRCQGRVGEASRPRRTILST